MCDPFTSVHHVHSQTANIAKFTLVPTAMPPDTYACTLSSQMNQVGIKLTGVSDESRFQLCPDDRRIRVWRHPGQHADPTFTIA
ncbi:hypothetical protein TNCV_3258761 [Trichonephila clavipes]|nr:hypothetical protein TNCV_3258761 [Trichonephila clavipes]